jgi:hypothetical protein
MNMYGFCRTTDLGQRDFYFSCKIQHTKLYTAFTKVVVLFSRKLAKLVSYFSDLSLNFYTFYKIQANHSKLEESYLYMGPWNFWFFTKVPLTLRCKNSKDAQRGDRRSWPTSGPVRRASSPQAIGGGFGVGGVFRGGTAKTGGGDRGEDCSDELLAGEYASVAWEASWCSRGGARRVGCRWERAEEGA